MMTTDPRGQGLLLGAGVEVGHGVFFWGPCRRP